MLFNTYIFILGFLPVTFIGFFVLGHYSKKAAIIWLTCCSLYYYSSIDLFLLGLICLSISVNYCAGTGLVSSREKYPQYSQYFLAFGLIFNLILLGYFKYANFFIDSLNAALNTGFSLGNIILPIGISFYTFTQIAYLVDLYRDDIKNHSILNYCLFVTIFPHLIAGPIIHHQEIIPQFINNNTFKVQFSNLSAGLVFFFIGLFKKVCLADPLSVYVNQIFDLVNLGAHPTFYEAWIGALSFAFQIYFDFSGYSDMAIGLALMFNIHFPLNFSSPYKSSSVIDFWRTWHMTLSRFLRDYVYIPLGGNRKGMFRRYINLMITMLLGGLWHGAGLTYVCWGGLHGIYLSVNHLWRDIFKKSLPISGRWNTISTKTGVCVTFIAIVFAWVVFRAKNLHDALALWTAMIQLPPIPVSLSTSPVIGRIADLLHYPVADGLPHVYSDTMVLFHAFWIFVLFVMCMILPNTQTIMRYKPPLYDEHRERVPHERSFFSVEWKPDYKWFLFLFLIACIALGMMENVNEFIYYQF